MSKAIASVNVEGGGTASAGGDCCCGLNGCDCSFSGTPYELPNQFLVNATDPIILNEDPCASGYNPIWDSATWQLEESLPVRWKIFNKGTPGTGYYLYDTSFGYRPIDGYGASNTFTTIPSGSSVTLSGTDQTDGKCCIFFDSLGGSPGTPKATKQQLSYSINALTGTLEYAYQMQLPLSGPIFHGWNDGVPIYGSLGSYGYTAIAYHIVGGGSGLPLSGKRVFNIFPDISGSGWAAVIDAIHTRTRLLINGTFTALSTFTLSFQGQTTSGIAHNATAATIQSALESLSTIGSGNVSVVHSHDYSPPNLNYNIDLIGTFAFTEVTDPITIDDTLMICAPLSSCQALVQPYWYGHAEIDMLNPFTVYEAIGTLIDNPGTVTPV